MKTIKLTDDQFNTLFEFVDQKVEFIVDKFYKKIEKARAKQPKEEW